MLPNLALAHAFTLTLARFVRLLDCRGRAKRRRRFGYTVPVWNSQRESPSPHAHRRLFFRRDELRARKVALAIVALVLIGAGIASWFVAPREKVALELTFLRYTNEVWPTQTPTGPTMRVYSPLALMLASNSGNCSLEVLNVLARTNYQGVLPKVETGPLGGLEPLDPLVPV